MFGAARNPKVLMKQLSLLLATFFGIGKLPKAPGTWASLAALPLFWLLIPNLPLHVAVLVILFFVGVPLCTRAEKEMGEKDASSIVLDEVLGMGTALVAVPREYPYLIMAFLLFRFHSWIF